MTQLRFNNPPPDCGGYTDSLGIHHACAAEVKGVFFCRTCGRAQLEANKRKAIRADQRARWDRRMGKTYGPAPEGVDVFKGFRGEDK